MTSRFRRRDGMILAWASAPCRSARLCSPSRSPITCCVIADRWADALTFEDTHQLEMGGPRELVDRQNPLQTKTAIDQNSRVPREGDGVPGNADRGGGGG